MSRYSNHNIDRRGKEKMKNTNKILVIKYATTKKNVLYSRICGSQEEDRKFSRHILETMITFNHY